jgi:hypothetical protein
MPAYKADPKAWNHKNQNLDARENAYVPLKKAEARYRNATFGSRAFVA